VIVIAGIPSEPPIRLAIDAAEQAGIDHVVVNQRESSRMDLTVEVDERGVHGELHLPERTVDLEGVAGVYWRLMEAERLPENGPSARPADRERSLAFHGLLTSWVETASCRVANRIGPMGSNASKPYQALRIERIGFDTPPTVITTVPADVEQAGAAWGPLVYKSTSSVRSIVRTYDPGADDLEAIRLLPTQFQRTVPGTDVRVHVVGPDVHATEITCDAVDYRYAARDGEDAHLRPCELPADVADRCRALSAGLDLPFCGIDLRRSDDGRWWCFEVNPSPGYSYYEQHTDQPISGSLVRWLAEGDTPA
jgi:hypothetical protein